MPEPVATLAALCLGFAACAMLALSQHEHWIAAAGELPYPHARRLRIVRVSAALLLGGAVLACVAGHGGGFGMLLAMLLLAAGALGVAFTLAWRPRWLSPIAFLMCDFV